MSLPCPSCGEPGDVELGAPREVSVGTVAVALERRPAVACPSRHDLAPPDAIEAAMAAADASVTRARGRPFRGDRCARCGTQLTMPVRRTRWSVTVERSGEVPVLTLHFDLPATRCPSCGTDQVPSRSHEDLVVSVPAVFATTQASDPPG